MTLPFAAGLNEALERYHDEFVEDMFNTLERQNARKARSGHEVIYISRDELAQAVHGAYTVIAEALEGSSDECRRHFFDTLFPGLRDLGLRFSDVIGLVTAFFVHITRAIVLELPAEQRRDATNWVAEFSLHYVLDVTRVWVPE